jgi:hypothetical protein
MAHNKISVAPEEILRTIHQELYLQFFDAGKTEAKLAYNQLHAGTRLPLLEISSSKHGKVVGSLALDSSEFVGKLNYRQFRDALASHLNLVGERLNNKEGLNIMTSAETGAMLFNLPGAVKQDDTVNFLVTGIEQGKPGELTVRLMFLDPTHFLRR